MNKYEIYFNIYDYNGNDNNNNNTNKTIYILI